MPAPVAAPSTASKLPAAFVFPPSTSSLFPGPESARLASPLLESASISALRSNPPLVRDRSTRRRCSNRPRCSPASALRAPCSSSPWRRLVRPLDSRQTRSSRASPTAPHLRRRRSRRLRSPRHLPLPPPFAPATYRGVRRPRRRAAIADDDGVSRILHRPIHRFRVDRSRSSRRTHPSRVLAPRSHRHPPRRVLARVSSPLLPPPRAVRARRPPPPPLASTPTVAPRAQFTSTHHRARRPASRRPPPPSTAIIGLTCVSPSETDVVVVGVAASAPVDPPALSGMTRRRGARSTASPRVTASGPPDVPFHSHPCMHPSVRQPPAARSSRRKPTYTHTRTRVILGTKNDYCYYPPPPRDAIVSHRARRGRIERTSPRGVVERERARPASTRTRLLEKRSAVRR